LFKIDAQAEPSVMLAGGFALSSWTAAACRYLLVKQRAPANNRPLLHLHSIYFRGEEGQVSIPEQKEIVCELAGPSQHLLPATSKTASGSSSLCKTSSS
jgi:hypothetical protein